MKGVRYESIVASSPHLKHVGGSAPSSSAPLHLSSVHHGATLLLADLLQEVVGLQTQGGCVKIKYGTGQWSLEVLKPKIPRTIKAPFSDRKNKGRQVT